MGIARTLAAIAMDYPAALDWWYQRVDYERKLPKPGELSLDRMRDLLHRLGDPQDRLRIIHIAGSKGKGSTAAMFAAVGQAAGLRTGLYTSPHLCDIRERIRIDNELISPQQLSQILTHIRAAEGSEPATFFEIATAAGFLHFATEGVAWAVIEVGLGGRFDATNVCQPSLCVITSISYEHTAILGDRLEQIAFEKCGIIKPGVAVVSGVTCPEAAPVVSRIAGERGCPLRRLGVDFAFRYQPGRVSRKGQVAPSHMIYRNVDGIEEPFELNLLGEHQAANASLTVAGAHWLFPRPFESANALKVGLRSARWPARMEVFPGSPLVVLDCAHNGASAQAVVDTLAESFPEESRTLIFASSADKDVSAILATLLPAFSAAVFTRFDNPRAIPPARLCETAASIRADMDLTSHDKPAEALAAARRQGRTIVICGSVYLAGELRPILMANC